MTNFETIKPKVAEILEDTLSKNNLKIYEINNFSEFGDDILQILLEDKIDSRKPLDFDLLTKVTEEVSTEIDKLDDLFKANYMLEVASAGIEKQIKTKEDLEKSIGDYIFAEFNAPEKGIVEFNGTLQEYNPETEEFLFTFFVKGQKKKRSAKFDDIKFIRYAVKF